MWALTLALLLAPQGAALDPGGLELEPLDGVAIVLTEEALDGSVGVATAEEEVEVTLASDVLFGFDEATLAPAAAAPLDEVREALAGTTGPVRIVGHTDDVGSDAYNDDLSLRRAEEVRDALASDLAAAGVQARVEGRGEREPVAANQLDDGSDNPEGRARNRRVTVTVPHRDGPSGEDGT